MDEVFELADVVADSELEGLFVWLLRLVGLLAILGGLALWLLTDVSLLVPLALLVGGIALLVVPGLLLEFAELFG
ncbi:MULTISPECIES: hypothetical protein [unclassified Natrinema]|uniref:hypothetical protein n=1 Tax=unclassified Natrinema TaxID=2622230 RepID=UPI00026D4483|nr:MULTISPECIES: hypothetical protein [unclassified Natrinema]AFO58282.1 hypothetical protein NJ7G_3061 [Natrinema sp. J7-2]